MKVRFKTGEMAKHFNISKQTLIYYDKIGIFSPEESDNNTGYRYYNLDQFERLYAILALKSLGMSLKQINTYMQAPLEERIEKLQQQADIAERKIKEIQIAKSRLQAMVTDFQKRNELNFGETGIKHIPKRPFKSVNVEPPYNWYELEIAIKKLVEQCADTEEFTLHNISITYDADLGDTHAYRKALAYTEASSDGYIEAGKYAYLIHKGAYDTLMDAKNRLLSFVEKEGLRHKGLVIEDFLFDSLAMAKEEDFVVCMMVRVE